jgi:hypothetical protein
MRAAVLVVALVGLNACSNALVKASFNSNTGVPAPASAAVSGGQASVRVVSTGSSAAALAGLFAFAALMSIEDARYAGASTSFASSDDPFWSRPAPELDPDRKISEQDCSRPLDLSLGNIRCK